MPYVYRKKVYKTQAEMDAQLGLDALNTGTLYDNKRRCPLHKRYRGLRRPLVACAGCWEIYLAAIWRKYFDKT